MYLQTGFASWFDGVPIDPFTDEATFIDVILLKRRNAIAHGPAGDTGRR